jgi:hypothetical protein
MNTDHRLPVFLLWANDKAVTGLQQDSKRWVSSDRRTAHMKMLRNEHKPGNMAVLVRTFEDTLEASVGR